jgi:DNA primase
METTETTAVTDVPVDAVAEEMYELQAGKNPDGSPLTKSFTKADLLKLAQTGFGANERFEEAKTTKAQMLELAQMLKDPERVFDVLKQLGHDPDELVGKRYARSLEERLKSPEQVEYEKLSKDAEEWRAFKAKQDKEEQEKSQNAEASRIQTELYTKLEGALSQAGVKPTKASVAEASKYIQTLFRQATARGERLDLATIPVEKIAQHIKKQYSTGITGYLGELDDDSILSEIPEELLNKIGAALTRKLQGSAFKPIAVPKGQPARQETKRKFMSLDESRGGLNRFSR